MSLHPVFAGIIQAHAPHLSPEIPAKKEAPCACEPHKPEGWKDMTPEEQVSFEAGFHAAEIVYEKKIAAIEKRLSAVNSDLQIAFLEAGNRTPFDEARE